MTGFVPREYQTRAVNQVFDMIEKGERLIVLTMPPRAGKSLVAQMLIEEAHKRYGSKSVFYTHRVDLTKQVVDKFDANGLMVGVRAAGWKPKMWKEHQVASIWTEHSRAVKNEQRDLHSAQLIIPDEAHMMAGETCKEVFRRHYAEGGVFVGLTATPAGAMWQIFQKLIVGTTNSELRETGAHVWCKTIGCPEIDVSKIKCVEGEDISEAKLAKAVPRWQLIGNIFESWTQHNPDREPTICFATDVASSRWLAEQFGELYQIPAAHVDASAAYMNRFCPGGEQELKGNAAKEARQDILKMNAAGKIPIITNRFIWREGIDQSAWKCLIAATVFGSVSSYVQACSRVLTAHPGQEEVILLDHGGSWWRHGSINANRLWFPGCTNRSLYKLRERGICLNNEPQPVRCRKCGTVRTPGECPSMAVCPACGSTGESAPFSRPILMADGKMVNLDKSPFKKRRYYYGSDAQKIWDKCYYRCRKSGRTFSQSEALFFLENGYRWPPTNLKNMPKFARMWFSKIQDVPKEFLTGYEDGPQQTDLF